jgi:uncharacterized protein
MRYFSFLIVQLFIFSLSEAQHISDFISLTPVGQTSKFVFPSATHKFQKILEHGDPISNGMAMDNFDFTGYLPSNGSSTSGYLALNHELNIGGVTAMDMNLNPVTQLWQPTTITKLDFTAVNGTRNNCSGGITPWGTTITCEEGVSTLDTNLDGYNDLGWMVEIDPKNKLVIGKLWAMGCGKKENIFIHSNRRTAYFGNDDMPGYLYKFVATSNDNLNSGMLYAYKGSKSGMGEWVIIQNTTIADRNNTMQLCNAAGATVFNGIEDVEIGTDGKIYLAVKNESCVYRFTDSDPISGTTVSNFETYVGNMSYPITHAGGTTLTPWGAGNDNLAFDNLGNLWVLQDGGNNYVWVVMQNHSQANPNVKLFGIAPSGSEPTGITFTPDFRYLFMSIQHPNAANSIDFQTDAAGKAIGFGKDIAMVIALGENLGCNQTGNACDDQNANTYNDRYDSLCNCKGAQINDTLNSQLSSGSQDAEENILNGSVNLISTDLELGNDGATPQVTAIMFSQLSIPKGSLIQSATIRFTVDEATSAPTNVIIKGEKSAIPLPLTTTAFNLTSRVKTTDSITWNIPAWNTVGQSAADQTTPEIRSIIQEIVNQDNWPGTNGSIVLFIRGNGARVAVSHDGSPAQSPVLTIAFTLQNINNVGIGQPAPVSKLQVKDGDIFVETIGAGVILKSPDGKCWKITVTNDGTVQAVSVTCPL